ncbi:MAG TPA: hypothetical protein DHU75_07065 [Rikenellaceae bacterium]|nr:hypothetical protein [Rikenellaceae bacterium]
MKTISVILLQEERGNTSNAQHSIQQNGCNSIVEIKSNDFQAIETALHEQVADYVLLLTDLFALSYDDALHDALSVTDGAKLVCFGTVYEADNRNKFESDWYNPLLSPSISTIISHPGAFVACLWSRDLYKDLHLHGQNIYEALIGALLDSAEQCRFVPLNILTTSLHSADINRAVQAEKLRTHFVATHPILSGDYQFLFQKQDLTTDEESVVLEKFSRTRLFRMMMSARKLLKKMGYYKVKADYKRKKYIKQVRREDAIRIADIAKKIEALPFNMLHAKGDDTDIIVSLTTHGKRLSESAPYGIYSLFTQTVLPNRIVLSISQDDWNDDNLPPLIKRLQQSGLEVLYCRDVRSHTKLLPALAKYPDNPIITVDDDMIYEPHMIEELVTAYNHSDRKTVLCRQGCFPKKQNGKYISYMQWDDSGCFMTINPNVFVKCISPAGVSGVLYPPRIFDKEIFNDDVFLKIAPHTDDIWFWLMEVRSGIKAELVLHTQRQQDISVSMIEYLQENESTALYFENCFNGRNDKEMYALLEYYGM